MSGKLASLVGYLKSSLDKLRWLILAQVTFGEKVKFSKKLNLHLELNSNWLVDFIIDQKGIFQPEIIQLIHKEAKTMQAELCIDIGAYIGQMGLFAKKHHPQMEVWLIEPQKILADKIRKNARLNKLDVKIFEIAIGEKNEDVYIDTQAWPKDAYGKQNPGALNFTRSKKKTPQKLSIRRLDDWIAQMSTNIPKRILLKIDVENEELQVLKSMDKLFEACDVIHVIIELNFKNRPGKQAEFEAWMHQHQIGIHPVEKHTLQKPYQGDFLLKWQRS